MPKAAACLHFRQRAGRFDWRQISSINVEDVVVHWKVEELQAILDHVTFSEFLPVDVRNNTIESVSKLVQIMQLIIEYLLNHQEIQLKQVRDLTKKVRHTKDERDKAQRSNLSLTEEIKTYQRQLYVLRKSLMSAGVAVPETPKQSAKVLDPFEIEKKDQTEHMLLAIMDHEQKARTQMISMLDDQRKTFATEISALVSTIKDLKSSEGAHDTSHKLLAMFEALKKQFEGQCSQVLQAAQVHQSSRSAPTPASGHVGPGGAESSHLSLLKDAAREVELENLMRQQSALEVYERQLRQRELAVAQREAASRVVSAATGHSALPSTSSTALRSGNEEVSLVRRKASLQLLRAAVVRALKTKLGRRFRDWAFKTYEARAASAVAFQSSAPSQRVQQLNVQLDSERQKAAALEVRCGELTQELRSAHHRVEALTASQKVRAKQDQAWEELLRLEKERVASLADKYDALVRKAEAEKADLLAQLAVGRSSVTPLRRTSITDRSMMTSMELPASSLSRLVGQGINTSTQIDDGGLEATAEVDAADRSGLDAAKANVASRYLELGEEGLLDEALARIASRRPLVMGTQKAAMITLAEELSARLGGL